MADGGAGAATGDAGGRISGVPRTAGVAKSLRPFERACAISAMSRAGTLSIEFRWAEGQYDRLSDWWPILFVARSTSSLPSGTPGRTRPSSDHDDSYRLRDRR